MKKILCIITLCFMLSACEDKINASTPDKYEQSVISMTEKMETSEKRQFVNALNAIMLDTGTNIDAIIAANRAGSEPMEKFYARIDGKTKDEILEMANNLKLKRQLQDTLSRRQR